MANKQESYKLEIEATYFTEWIEAQIEEGHGYHDVGSYHNVELGKIVITLSNGNRIDITNQLDKYTKQAIYLEIIERL